jgi:hypothetical protein
MSLLEREVCTCGHGGHEHAPKLSRTGPRVALLPGLGTCGVRGCKCEKFHFGHWHSPRRPVKRPARRRVVA